MKNKIKDGKTINYTASADIESGDLVVVGVRVGVAVTDIANGESGVLEMEGVFELPKATGAISQGALVYWDADGTPVGGASGDGCLTTTSSANTLAGYVVEAAGETAATVKVKINA